MGFINKYRFYAGKKGRSNKKRFYAGKKGQSKKNVRDPKMSFIFKILKSK